MLRCLSFARKTARSSGELAAGATRAQEVGASAWFVVEPSHRRPISTSQKPLRVPASCVDQPRDAHLHPLERILVAAGSAAVSLLDPARGDMVALLGEMTGSAALEQLRVLLESSEDGRWILQHRPRIREQTLKDARVLDLPAHTFGGAYAAYIAAHGFSPDGRHEVVCGDDETLRYVLQRYREVHDLWHVLSGLPASVVGEAALKWFEMVQTGLPVAALAALASPLRMAPTERAAYRQLVTWASRAGRNAVPLIAVRYEMLWELDLEEVRDRLQFEPAPRVLCA